ncbi:17700_t:CDS:2, partial [Racocetra persica]
WLEMAGMSSRIQEYLGAILRLHKGRGLKSPTEDYRVKKVVRGIKLLRAHDQDAVWPRDPFPLEALRQYHDNPSEKVDPVIWCFRTMRRPGELCKLRKNDVERKSGLVWLRVRKTKNDPFANRKFVPIEPSGWEMSVAAISSVIKRMTENVKIVGRFTSHSLRIGRAAAAMRGGMSLAQIRTIGGWDLKAVMLYLRAVETTKDGASIKMGF